jgi:capsular polysaccharide biosynthesis protein
LRPYLETLFRLPLLFIVPALALPVLVFLGQKAMPQTYKVTATLWVDSPSTLQRNQTGQIQTASATEAQTFRERLSTNAFRDQVIKDAGLTDSVNNLKWPKGQAPGKWLAKVPVISPLARALGGTDPADKDAAWKRAYATLLKLQIKDEGNNVFTVTYLGPEGDIGQKLVNAAAKNFLSEKAATNKRKIDERNAVNQGYVDSARVDMENARNAYQDFLGTLPAEPSSNQTRRLGLLQSAYEDSLRNLQQMRLNQVQAAEGVVQEVTNDSRNVILVDAPTPGKPPVPAYGLKHMAVLAIAAGFLGLALGGILIVFRTWMDRALRVTADVQLRLQAPVVGSLPTINIRQLRGGDSWSAN